MTRYIFIAGGVMSGVGKGVATASLGAILKSKGFKVQAMKIDPYVNIDAGTMNPIEHGEVFVLDDGDECDQDLGNYERFLDENLCRDNYMTTGRVYLSVIKKERNLDYNGKCVQVVPHIPEEVIRRIKNLERKKKPDFILIEIGGTVGEYENLIFLEAVRMLKIARPKAVLFILVSFLPIPGIIEEMKTKPTQHAVRAVQGAGIQPDIIIARSRLPLDNLRKEKIFKFCNVAKENVISAPDISSIYEIPINFEKDNLSARILKKFGLPTRKNDLKNWENLIKTINKPKRKVKIGVVGKYFKTGGFVLKDSYISVLEAIKHAAYFFGAAPEIIWLDAEKYEKNKNNLKELKNIQGIIVPGGFGSRGVEGKIKAIEFVRKNKIPFLGLCLGMQMAVVEFARNVCGIKNACSTEFSENCQPFTDASVKGQEPVIAVMNEQKEKLKNKNYGGTMRLGAYACQLNPKGKSFKAYKVPLVFERHRHRYEFNNKYREILEKKGLLIAGVNPESRLAEIIEIPKHPFFVGTQFHPEFKSRPFKPHPLFREFVRAAINK